MKLRKVLAVILLSLVVFAFPSCDFLSGMFGGGEAWEPGTPNEPVEPQTPPDTEDGNAYLGYPTSTSGSNVQLIKHNGYTLLYSYDDLIPLWVMWHLDADDLGTEERMLLMRIPLFLLSMLLDIVIILIPALTEAICVLMLIEVHLQHLQMRHSI